MPSGLCSVAVLLFCALQQPGSDSEKRSDTRLCEERKACDSGRWDQCVTLASRYLLDESGTADALATASTLFRKACDGGNAQGCLGLADRYAAGEGVPKDTAAGARIRKRAERILRTQCDSGVVNSCVALAQVVAEHTASSAERNRLIAAAALDGCGRGDASSCRVSAAMYARGDGVARDDVIALEFYVKACHGNDISSCLLLAMDYDTPGGLAAQDDEKAAEYFGRACRLGRADACVAAGVKHEEGRWPGRGSEQAAGWYQRGCDAGAPTGCYRLARLLESGEGVPTDTARAKELFQVACAHNLADACRALGRPE